ncbi:1632_t:CDS:2 [Diversispora eburnea]|uniref:1632_t:CDS:1 n=1 Tax=Diversispora eburnea TaxID=1213867 RepID=A0A9N9BXI2_9GLOM|nr:1632_t:CDS:2 [Diversispora eburnea]
MFPSAFGNTGPSGGFGTSLPGGGFGGNQPIQPAVPFGNTSTAGFGGGFGTVNTNTNAAPTFGFSVNQTSTPFGFGGNFSQPQTSAPFGFGGNFSQPSVSNVGNFGFGRGAQQTQPSGFGLFQPTTSKPSGFGFGGGVQPVQPNIFGAQTTTTNPFGSTQSVPNAPVFGLDIFRTQRSFGFTSSQPQTQTQIGTISQTGTISQQQSSTPQQMTTYEELSRLINAWNTESPECQFQSYFYNMVHPDVVQLYTPPPNMPQSLWNEAQLNNPDRTILVPARVAGFDDIKKRLEMQEVITAKAIAKFKEYSEQLEEMERKHNLETLVRIEDRKRKHIELTQRVIKLMRQIQVLRLKGTLIRSDEEDLKGRLEEIKQHLERPNLKLAMLKTQYGVTKTQWSSRESLITHKFNAVDGNQLENIIKVLDVEQTGIVHDIETLKKDSKDIDIIIRSFKDTK